jgi:hypothetical protein
MITLLTLVVAASLTKKIRLPKIVNVAVYCLLVLCTVALAYLVCVNLCNALVALADFVAATTILVLMLRGERVR